MVFSFPWAEGVGALTVFLIEDARHLLGVLSRNKGHVPHLFQGNAPPGNIRAATISAKSEKTAEDALSDDIEPSKEGSESTQ